MKNGYVEILEKCEYCTLNKDNYCDSFCEKYEQKISYTLPPYLQAYSTNFLNLTLPDIKKCENHCFTYRYIEEKTQITSDII